MGLATVMYARLFIQYDVESMQVNQYHAFVERINNVSNALK